MVPSRKESSEAFWRRLLVTVADTLAAHDMVRAGQAVLVGVSGGVDSVTLLWALRQLAPHLGIRLGVAHLNHCLRGTAAEEDLARVGRLAAAAGLPFHPRAEDVARRARHRRLSLEEAARQARYEFFRKIADESGYDKVATAHHADDNAEQVLLNLIRGSGPAGLAGIPPVREDWIIRPLLRLPRSDLTRAARLQQLEFAEDATNQDMTFLRNRVRHQLLPLLRESCNPAMDDNLNRLAALFREENAWLEPLVEERFDRVLRRKTAGELVLSVSGLREHPRALQQRLFRLAIERIKGDLRRVTFDHGETFSRLLHSGRPAALDLPGGIRIFRRDNDLVIRAGISRQQPRQESPAFAYRVFATGLADRALPIPETGAQLDFALMNRREIPDPAAAPAGTAFCDADRLALPLTVRSLRPGDRFVPLGMNGTQKVKDFFINHKVPRHLRRRCPVVADADRIIWLAGFRLADPVKITADTRRILQITLSEPGGARAG